MTLEDIRKLERFFIALRWLALLALAVWLPWTALPFLGLAFVYNMLAMLAARRPDTFARWERFVRLWARVADAALITFGIFVLRENTSQLALLYGIVVFGLGISYGAFEGLCAAATFSGLYWLSLLTASHSDWGDSMRLAIANRVGFLALMAAIGGYSSIQWQKYRRIANTSRRLAALNALSEQIALAKDRREILRLAVDAAQEQAAADCSAVLLLTDDASKLVLSAQRGLSDSAASGAVPIGQGLVGNVAAACEPVSVRLPAPDGQSPTPFADRGSCVVVPLQGGGETIGVLGVWRADCDSPFADEDVRVLMTIAGYSAIALSNIELIERLKDAAVRDSLTGVYNHGFYLDFLESEVAESLGRGECISVVLLDVDRFKRINDEFGHPRGDAALIGVARCLQDLARDTDLVARCGGDEFAVVLRHADADDGEIVARRIARHLSEPDGAERLPAGRPLTASFGIASAPSDAADAEGLIRLADEALYAAKSAGRNAFVLARDLRQDESLAGSSNLVSLLS